MLIVTDGTHNIRIGESISDSLNFLGDPIGSEWKVVIAEVANLQLDKRFTGLVIQKVKVIDYKNKTEKILDPEAFRLILPSVLQGAVYPHLYHASYSSGEAKYQYDATASSSASDKEADRIKSNAIDFAWSFGEVSSLTFAKPHAVNNLGEPLENLQQQAREQIANETDPKELSSILSWSKPRLSEEPRPTLRGKPRVNKHLLQRLEFIAKLSRIKKAKSALLAKSVKRIYPSGPTFEIKLEPQENEPSKAVSSASRAKPVYKLIGGLEEIALLNQGGSFLSEELPFEVVSSSAVELTPAPKVWLTPKKVTLTPRAQVVSRNEDLNLDSVEVTLTPRAQVVSRSEGLNLDSEVEWYAPVVLQSNPKYGGFRFTSDWFKTTPKR